MASHISMREMMEARGIPWGDLSPQQEFAAYTTQAFRPGPSPTRTAFWGVEDPLMQQFTLTQPFLEDYGSFTDFMGQYNMPQWSPYGGESLKRRAQEAATVSGLTESQWLQYMAPQAQSAYDTAADYTAAQVTSEEQARLDAMNEAQLFMYRQAYGTGEQAMTNQAQLANMLALQRTGTGAIGMYGGQYGSAIGRAMEEVQRQLRIRNPETNFLDWYLERVGDTGMGTAGLFPARRALPAATPTPGA